MGGDVTSYKPLEVEPSGASDDKSLIEKYRKEMVLGGIVLVSLVLIVTILFSLIIGFVIGYELHSTSPDSSSSVYTSTDESYDSNPVQENPNGTTTLPREVIYGTWRSDKQRTNQFHSSASSELSWASEVSFNPEAIPVPTRQDIVLIPSFNINVDSKITAINYKTGISVNEVVFDETFFEIDNIYTFIGNSETEDFGIAITRANGNFMPKVISFQVTSDLGIQLTSTLRPLPVSYTSIWLDNVATGLFTISTCDNNFAFIDLATLELIWSVDVAPAKVMQHVITLSNKVIIGGRIGNTHKAFAFDFAGKLIWDTESFDTDVFDYAHQNPDDSFYFSMGATTSNEREFFFVSVESECDDEDSGPFRTELHSIDSNTGDINWSVELFDDDEHECDAEPESSVSLLETPDEFPDFPYLIIVWYNGVVYCYSPSGELLWAVDAYYVSAIMPDGRILMQYGDIYSSAGVLLDKKYSPDAIQTDSLVDQNMNSFYSVYPGYNLRLG